MANLYGTKQNQVPTNNDLGTMAFLDMEGADRINVKKATVTTLKADPVKLLKNATGTRLISNGSLLPDQVPLNSELGSLAFQNADSVKITGGTINSSTFTTTTLVGAYQNTNRTAATPSLYLNFAKSEVLDPRITFTRASTATYIGSDGYIKTAAVNTPRFDHDPVTGEGLGFLIEAPSTNLLLYSEQFDNAAWIKSTTTVSANAITAPDGTLNADTISRTASGNHYIFQIYTTTSHASKTYTFSVWLKSGTLTGNTTLRIRDGSNAAEVGFSSITPISTWQRFSVTGTFGASPPANIIVYIDPANDVGSPGDTLYAWGAQLEENAYATSYIPTTTATVTRAADAAEMSIANWYTEVGGTFLLDFKIDRSTSGNTNRIFDINAGSLTSRLSVYHNSSGAVVLFNNNGGTTASTSGSATALGVNKVAFTVKDNDVRASLNGGTVYSIGTVNIYDGITKIQFGTYPGSSTANMNGYIKSVRYYPAVLANAELIEMTA